jgi:glycosyltransferase involved in cell wall biosynthesis
MENKKITVIIPTYNSENFIERCINKVLSQTYSNIEILAIDDGSTDQTVPLLHSYGDKVKVLQNDVNQGPAYSRTKGLFECQGDYVAFLDADDYWDEDFVSATVSFLNEYPEVVAVSTAYEGIDLKGNSVQKPNLNEDDKNFYKITGSICLDFFEFWSRYFGVLTGTVMMRTEVARETKGQRKELRLTEDLEFWGYLSTFGKWGFIPRPLFTTDPGILLPSERLKKMQDRYEFFSDLKIEEWSKRIDRQIGEEQSQSYKKIVNHIKTTIATANAYILRYKESYKLVGMWKNDLEPGLGGVLRKGHALGRFIWPGICMALKIREFFKSYMFHFLRKIKPSHHSKSKQQ